MSNFYFFYQPVEEGPWVIDAAESRDRVVSELHPPFVTALDLSHVPEDDDYSKVTYQGPLYFDFDADGDLDRACDGFKDFLGKLYSEFTLDLGSVRLYASGGKGFHVEIPQACFVVKSTAKGFAYLPYVYREIANSLSTDTMDFSVYTGRKGRMWRTTNVLRKNGKYKVPLTLDEAMNINAEAYLELVSAPRPRPPVMPPKVCPALAMAFDRAREKIQQGARGKAKRKEKAVAALAPWRAIKKDPPTLEKVMAGEHLKEGVGFQSIAMQLSIYATSVGMTKGDFLKKCEGLCETHSSDSYRYNSYAKRQRELSRMYSYMDDSPLYDFDVGPIINLLEKGYVATDFGQMEKELPPEEGDESAEGDDAEPSEEDDLKGVRGGFFMNSKGMYATRGEVTDTISRAVFYNSTLIVAAELPDVLVGYEIDVRVGGKKHSTVLLPTDTFASSSSMRRFLMGKGIAYQGNDSHTTALFDIIQQQAAKKTPEYVYPREGFMVINHPGKNVRTPVKCYLTEDCFMSQIDKSDPDYFTMRYRPEGATSAYRTDIHTSPDLDDSMVPYLYDLFNISTPESTASLLGWFVASHYRSMFLYAYKQFPLLQVYGTAGSGKTQTVTLLAHLHWHLNDVRNQSAMSGTPFYMDQLASSTTSVPFIIDEYKPRELKKKTGQYEYVKNLFKMNYTGDIVGGRGRLNKSGGESNLTTEVNRALAPIAFIGESVEMETAIMERCVMVNLDKAYHTTSRKAGYARMRAKPVFLSALGKNIMLSGFLLDVETLREIMDRYVAKLRLQLEKEGKDPSEFERHIYNKAVALFGLEALREVLKRPYGDQFTDLIDGMIEDYMTVTSSADAAIARFSSSEISKTMSRISLNSRDVDTNYELRMGKDYVVGEGWVEINVDRCYDSYRRYCAIHGETPLFDTINAFRIAVATYNAVIDQGCLNSELRDDNASANIVRLNALKMAKEGVHAFRT